MYASKLRKNILRSLHATFAETAKGCKGFVYVSMPKELQICCQCWVCVVPILLSGGCPMSESGRIKLDEVCNGCSVCGEKLDVLLPFAQSLCPKDPERQSWLDAIYAEDFLGGTGLNSMRWTLQRLFLGFCDVLSYPLQSLPLRSTIGQVRAQAHRTNLGIGLMDAIDQYRPGTSSTAQGGGGSFKDRKPIGEVGCCGAWMAERILWWTERWLELCVLEWLQWLSGPLTHNCWMQCGVVQLYL